MTPEHSKELSKALKEKAEEISGSKEKALKFFQEVGILDEDGKHTEPYRELDQLCTVSTQD